MTGGNIRSNNKSFEAWAMEEFQRLNGLINTNTNIDNGNYQSPRPVIQKSFKDYLNLNQGGVLASPIAWNPSKTTIDTGAIDIGRDSGKLSGFVIVSAETGTTDDLTDINNFVFGYQDLTLLAAAGHIITIKTTGNVNISEDLALTDSQAATLFYNTISESWEIKGGIGDGGGTGITFPITPPVDVRGSVGANQNIVLTDTDAHSTTLTLTADIDITFSGFPTSGTQIEWEVEITQDGTGGWVVTWPAEVVNPPSLSTVADSVAIVVLRTNDGGTTVRVGNTVTTSAGTTTLSGLTIDVLKDWQALGISNFGPLTGVTEIDMAGDIDMNTFDIFAIDNLQFNPVTGSLFAAVLGITAIDSTGLRIQVVADGKFRVTEDDDSIIPFEIDTLTDIATLNDTSLRLLNTTNNNFLEIQSTDTLVSFNSSINDMFFSVGGTNIAAIKSTGIELSGGLNVSGVGTLGMAQSGQGIESPSVSEIRLTTNSVASIYSNTHSFEFAQFSAENILTTPIPFLAIEEGEIILSSIVIPPDSAAVTIGKIFMDSTNSNHLSIKRLATVVDLEGGGGSQTPWTSNIDADGFSLTDFGRLEYRTAIGAGLATIAWQSWDGVSLQSNVPSGDTFVWSVNNTDAWTMTETTFTGIALIANQSLQIISSGTNPTANGEFRRDGNEVELQAESFNIRNDTSISTEYSELSLIKVDADPILSDFVGRLNFGIDDSGTVVNYAGVYGAAKEITDSGILQLVARSNNGQNTIGIQIEGDDDITRTYATINSKINSDFTFGVENGAGGTFIIAPDLNAGAGVELGIVVQDNVGFTTGTSGTLAMPSHTTAVPPTASELNGDFGTHEGAMGFSRPTTTTNDAGKLFIRNSDGAWFMFSSVLRIT